MSVYDERVEMLYSIMIVEDDQKIAGILEKHMKKYQYHAECTTDFYHVREHFVRFNPDLVLLDVNLPQYDGFYWCRQIRTLSNVPIIFISARTEKMDQVMAIENGGDDYITKPFSLDIVMAKIKSSLRRAYGDYAMQAEDKHLTELSGLILNHRKNTVTWQNRQEVLTHKEFQLLEKLVEMNGSIVSRDELLEILWDDISFVDDNTLTVNVTRVRKKLESLGIYQAIVTVRGQGYRFDITWR